MRFLCAGWSPFLFNRIAIVQDGRQMSRVVLTGYLSQAALTEGHLGEERETP